jgi:hypothetical protein
MRGAKCLSSDRLAVISTINASARKQRARWSEVFECIVCVVLFVKLPFGFGFRPGSLLPYRSHSPLPKETAAQGCKKLLPLEESFVLANPKISVVYAYDRPGRRLFAVAQAGAPVIRSACWR